MKVLVINGSYRENGHIDQALAAMTHTLEASGAVVEEIRLRDQSVGFCTNCRHCMQQPGDAPSNCIQKDDMQGLIVKIETSDAYIFASPTNFGSVTALFKRFMERLAVYAWWPWGARAPVLRNAVPTKTAVLLTSMAAPGWLGRLFFSTTPQLKLTAKTVGARSRGSYSMGFAAGEAHVELKPRELTRLQRLAARLLN